MYYEEKELDKFVSAQARDYDTALAEIRSGYKRSHWMWYIFPQLQGLGFSSTAGTEAGGDLRRPALSPRLQPLRRDGLPGRSEALLLHDTL